MIEDDIRECCRRLDKIEALLAHLVRGQTIPAGRMVAGMQAKTPDGRLVHCNGDYAEYTHVPCSFPTNDDLVEII